MRRRGRRVLTGRNHREERRWTRVVPHAITFLGHGLTLAHVEFVPALPLQEAHAFVRAHHRHRGEARGARRERRRE